MALFSLNEKTIRYGQLILFSALLCCLACNKKYRDCEQTVNYNCCTPFQVDSVTLDPTQAGWIPRQPAVFKNTNGGVIECKITWFGRGMSRYPYAYKSMPCECGGSSSCYDYISVASEKVLFKSPGGVFQYYYTRSAVLVDTAVMKFAEQLVIEFNNIEYALPINNPKTKYSEFRDSLSIGATVFTNVYHVYRDPATVDPRVIVPGGIYYTIQKGLVGFYLTNGETWVLQ